MDLKADVKKVVIIDNQGKEHLLTGENPEAQIISIKIVESIELYTITAELSIFDTAINLISSIPIVGMETVKMELVSPNISETVYEYEFVVYAIRNRIVSAGKQAYVLDLFSKEALINETIRVGQKIEGTADKVAKDILGKYLATKKDTSKFEPCLYRIKEIPALKRPFDIINSFLPHSISSSASSAGSSSSSSTKKGSGSTTQGSTQAVTKTTAAGVVSGTAGYLFFETYDGYVFKSIDKILKEDTNKHKTYYYGIAQTEGSDEESNSYLILNYNFPKQENIFEKLRYGVYSSMISFFNPSTLEYEEYFFDLSKEYPKMVHLGTEEDLPENVKKLSEYPTRVMLQFFDDETYHDSSTTASSNTQYPDFKKQWLAQSISRRQILNNQVLNIEIPINFQLRAGDKLNIKLPNQSVQDKRKEAAFDEVNSGLYLIKTISYEVIRDNSRGLTAVSNLTLIRDNLGS